MYPEYEKTLNIAMEIALQITRNAKIVENKILLEWAETL